MWPYGLDLCYFLELFLPLNYFFYDFLKMAPLPKEVKKKNISFRIQIIFFFRYFRIQINKSGQKKLIIFFSRSNI